MDFPTYGGLLKASETGCPEMISAPVERMIYLRCDIALPRDEIRLPAYIRRGREGAAGAPEIRIALDRRV